MNSLKLVQRYFPDVNRVEDAVKPVTIEVTKKDTKTAAVRDHRACAAAVACKRQLDCDGVIISRAIAYLIKANVATRYEVPVSLSKEVVAFDRGGVFEPGEYRLKKPYHGVALGVARTHRSNTHKRGKKKAAYHITTNVRTVLGSTT